MIQYLIQRILLFIPTLFLITVISFGISRLAPGDPAEAKTGVGAEGGMSSRAAVNEKTIELIRKQWNLDKPIFFVTIVQDAAKNDPKPWTERLTFRWNGWQNQYWIWTWKTMQFDFGTSFQDNRSVTDKILERLPITLIMSFIAIIVSYLIAIPLGIYSATHPGTVLDKISTFFLFALYSLPTFWVGTMAIVFLSNPEFLSIFRTGLRSVNFSEQWSMFAKLQDYAIHLTLPMLVYVYPTFAFISRQMRSGMLEVIRQDYIRTARAKGLSERTVIYKHALRNSLIPIITLLAGVLPGLVGGSVIVETIFSIPGMGKLALDAMVARDYPTIMAVFTISAVLTLVGILLADIMYSVVDPRISYSKKA